MGSGNFHGVTAAAQPGGSLVCGPPGSHLFQGPRQASRSKATGRCWGAGAPGEAGREGSPGEAGREGSPGVLVAFPRSGLTSSGPPLPAWLSPPLLVSSSERAGLVTLALGSHVRLQRQPGKHGCIRSRLGLPWWQSG